MVNQNFLLARRVAYAILHGDKNYCVLDPSKHCPMHLSLSLFFLVVQHFYFLLLYICLIVSIYFWPHWVFIAVLRLSLVAVGSGSSVVVLQLLTAAAFIVECGL